MDYTDQQLHDAWVIRRRQDWPDSFDLAMADDLLSRLVRLEAAAQLRAAARRAEPSAWHAPPPAPRMRHAPARRHAFDARCAAANDLETPDDEQP